jgi:colanic acid/amylovoran biosynthesis protein
VACLSELVPIGDQKSSPVNKSSFKKDLDLFKKCIRESDLVFSKGGSFIFSEGTIRGSARLSRVLYPLYFAISSKKPVVICSQSIWGLHSDLDKKISMPILSKSTISVRESLSQQYLQELDIKSNMVPDVAFYLSNKKDIPNPFLVYLREEKAIGTRFIGITVRPWLFEDGNKSYTNTLVQIMEKMCSANSHYKFLLIAQTIGPVEFEDDRIVIRQVIDSTPLNLRNKLIVFQEDVSPYVLKEIYGNLELLIGTRLHSLILAFSMGVPGISITYSEHKSKGIMKMLGLEEFVYDISNLHLDSIVENIEFILENRDKLSKQILAAIQSQKVEIYSFLKACMSKSKDKDFMSLTSEELSWKDNLLAKENEKVSFTG